MRVEVEKAPEGVRQTIWNLMQLYFHAMTEFSPREVDNQGLFAYQYFDSYWSDGDRYPFLIRADSAIAGFALVRFDEQGRADMAEFFVLRAHRRGGIGSAAARQLFEMFKGRWQVRQEPRNVVAQKFWRGVISEHTGGDFEDLAEGDDAWRGPIQRFDSRKTAVAG